MGNAANACGKTRTVYLCCISTRIFDKLALFLV